MTVTFHLNCENSPIYGQMAVIYIDFLATIRVYLLNFNLFEQNLLLILFGQLCEKYGLVFILTSSHTVPRSTVNSVTLLQVLPT